MEEIVKKSPGEGERPFFSNLTGNKQLIIEEKRERKWS